MRLSTTTFTIAMATILLVVAGTSNESPALTEEGYQWTGSEWSCSTTSPSKESGDCATIASQGNKGKAVNALLQEASGDTDNQRVQQCEDAKAAAAAACRFLDRVACTHAWKTAVPAKCQPGTKTITSARRVDLGEGLKHLNGLLSKMRRHPGQLSEVIHMIESAIRKTNEIQGVAKQTGCSRHLPSTRSMGTRFTMLMYRHRRRRDVGATARCTDVLPSSGTAPGRRKCNPAQDMCAIDGAIGTGSQCTKAWGGKVSCPDGIGPKGVLLTMHWHNKDMCAKWDSDRIASKSHGCIKTRDKIECTKASVIHGDEMSRSAGMIMYKRVVCRALVRKRLRRRPRTDVGEARTADVKLPPGCIKVRKGARAPAAGLLIPAMKRKAAHVKAGAIAPVNGIFCPSTKKDPAHTGHTIHKKGPAGTQCVQKPYQKNNKAPQKCCAHKLHRLGEARKGKRRRVRRRRARGYRSRRSHRHNVLYYCSVYKTGLCVDVRQDIWPHYWNDWMQSQKEPGKKFAKAVVKILKDNNGTLPSHNQCTDDRNADYDAMGRTHGGKSVACYTHADKKIGEEMLMML